MRLESGDGHKGSGPGLGAKLVFKKCSFWSYVFTYQALWSACHVLQECLPAVVLREQSAWLGWGLERQEPPTTPSRPRASFLLSHLVDGSFQAAQADAELQPPQEVVGHSDEDMQLFIHKAVQGSSFGQMAPGRPRSVRENPRC